jgi:hypothetical protein
VPKRVYVSYSPEDDPTAHDALVQALTQAGHELERRWAVIQAAVVVVGPLAVKSAEVVADVRDLLERQADNRFPIVPLLLDGVSPADLGLHVLASFQMSTAATLADRITETLAAIETPAAEGISRPAEHPDHPFTTIRTINATLAGAAVTSSRPPGSWP